MAHSTCARGDSKEEMTDNHGSGVVAMTSTSRLVMCWDRGMRIGHTPRYHHRTEDVVSRVKARLRHSHGYPPLAPSPRDLTIMHLPPPPPDMLLPPEQFTASTAGIRAFSSTLPPYPPPLTASSIQTNCSCTHNCPDSYPRF
jgi:hypothetical protein